MSDGDYELTDGCVVLTAMKRSASTDALTDDDSSTKRRRSSGRAIDVRFLLQSKNAGAIIGKGGSNINRLRKDYKASVTVPDCPGPERILTIVADVETIGDILKDIIPKLEDYSHHRTMSFDCEMRMLLHQSHTGCVIGRGGQRIKELREKTGSQIKVYTSCCPESTERVAQISGFPEVVINCVKEILDLIGQAPMKGPSQLYDPHNFSVFYAPEYGGYGESGGRGSGGGGGGGGGRGGGGRGGGGAPRGRGGSRGGGGGGGPGGSRGGSRGGRGGMSRGRGGGGPTPWQQNDGNGYGSNDMYDRGANSGARGGYGGGGFPPRPPAGQPPYQPVAPVMGDDRAQQPMWRDAEAPAAQDNYGWVSYPQNFYKD